MRKSSAILALFVGLLLVGIWISMNRDDAKDAAANISRGYIEIRSGSDSAFQQDMDESRSRQNQEIIFGIAGAVFLVAGLAIYPYRSNSRLNEHPSV